MIPKNSKYIFVKMRYLDTRYMNQFIELVSPKFNICVYSAG